MKKRLAFLVLTGALVYFASEKVVMAECVPECWDSGGWICCTDAHCRDYCW
jgi:hypothetical protein